MGIYATALVVKKIPSCFSIFHFVKLRKSHCHTPTSPEALSLCRYIETYTVYYPLLCPKPRRVIGKIKNSGFMELISS